MKEQMKPSGIAWIGDIPAGCDVKRVKYIIQNNADGIKVGPFGSALTNEVVSGEEGKYKIYGQANLIRKDFDYGDNFVTEENYRRLINYEVLPDDIAVSMMGTIGKCSVVPHGIQPGIMDSHLIKIRLSKKMSPRFFEYIYESCVVYEQLIVNSKGSIMNGLNSTIVKSVFLAVPSIDEQAAITNFLDAQCAKIDGIIADIEKQIETLQKYKKSLITETVTKGLDKSVSLKESSVSWIGTIPQAWKVCPIGYMSTSRSGGTPDRNNLEYWENGTIPWMASGEVNKVNVYDTDERITLQATYNSSAKIVKKNSVMVALNGQGKTKGMSAILRIDSACNQSLCAFSCFENVLYYEYLFWCFQSMYTYLRQMSGDAVRDGLAASYVRKQKIPVPPFSEQQEIAEYLNKKCRKIDEIMVAKQTQLKTIQQHKESLIYEYVTGKKRVTEVN